jgi:methionyl-tRNA formyltransferase
LIKECVKNNPKPSPQEGNVQIYKRNKDNSLPLEKTSDLSKIHKFIQMLDGEHYPNAFLDVGNFRLTFSRSKIREGEILSDVVIRRKDG